MTLASEIMRTRVGTVMLTEDCTENIEILEGMGIVLDLAGHRLANAKNDYTIKNRGDLTIIDSVGGGSVYNNAPLKGCLLNDGPGNVVIRDGVGFSLNSRPNNQSWYCIVNLGGLMQIDDAIVTGISDFTTAVRNGYYNEEPDGHSPVMVINGGTFSSQKIPVKNDSFGKMIINGGEFTSPNECVLTWNDCTINSGTFTTTANYTVFTGAYTDPGCGGDFVINGGTFDGTKGIIRDLTPEYAPDIAIPPTLEVRGGSFNMAVDSKFLAPGVEMSSAGGRSEAVKFGWDVTSFGSTEMQHMRRMIIRAPRMQYVAGGIDLPNIGFTPVTVMGASAEGGIMAYYDESTRKLRLYRNGAEASGTVTDLSVILLGV